MRLEASNDGLTPKLLPAPRIAQKSSDHFVSSAICTGIGGSTEEVVIWRAQ